VTCQQVDELAAGYVLGAVTAEQREEIDAHLESCHEHSMLMREMRATVGVLHHAVPDHEPSSTLKSRILAAARSDVATLDVPRPAPAPIEFSQKSYGWRLPVPFGAAVAAVALIIAGLLAWNVVLQFSKPEETEAFVRYMGTEEIHAFVYYVEDVGVITASGMVPLSGDRTYQAWAVVNGAPVSLGLLEVDDDGEGYVLLDQHVTEKEPVFITIEKAGGSPTPTGAKVVWTED
jgi:anti-sigma-K factor RskA